MKYTKDHLIQELNKKGIEINNAKTMTMKQLRLILEDAVIKESKEKAPNSRKTHQIDL